MAFETNTGLRGHVPATIELPNGVAVDIRYDSDMDGGVDATHQSVPQLSGASAGNLIAGGLIGQVIDASNPKTRVHQRRQVLGTPYKITLPAAISADLKAHGVDPEEFIDWPEYRRSQAQVNLSDKEFSMWEKYNDVIWDQYNREAADAIARVKANQAAGLEPSNRAVGFESREAGLPSGN